MVQRWQGREVVAGQSRLERTVRRLFVLSGLVTAGTLIGLSLNYRENLTDRFEIVAVTIDWTELMVGGILSAVLFRRAGETPRGVGLVRHVAAVGRTAGTPVAGKEV